MDTNGSKQLVWMKQTLPRMATKQTSLVIFVGDRDRGEGAMALVLSYPPGVWDDLISMVEIFTPLSTILHI